MQSCSEETVIIPAYVINQEKMVTVMTEVHISEAYMASNNIYGDSAKKVAPIFYGEVFKRNGISKEEFDTSFGFYLRHPSLMEKIEAKVLDKLNERNNR